MADKKFATAARVDRLMQTYKQDKNISARDARGEDVTQLGRPFESAKSPSTEFADSLKAGYKDYSDRNPHPKAKPSSFKKGGVVKKSGWARVHKGETVVPTKHPGFKAVQSKIAKKYGMKKAGAILGASTRRASASAKRRNPRLKRVLLAKKK
jgi:hypothetical protein